MQVHLLDNANVIHMSNFPKWIYRFKIIPLKISRDLLSEINNLILKRTWKCKGQYNNQDILREEQN